MIARREPVPELDALQQQAVAWVQRMRSGEATADDAKALKAWCAESAAHAAALANADRVWINIVPASLMLPGGDGAASKLGRRMDGRDRAIGRRALLGGGLTAAAAAGAYVLVRPPLDLWPSLAEFAADYRTATGEQRQIVVADDISVQLNTQSSIAVEPARADGDRIQLISGEASFVTSSRTERTLMVSVAEGTIIGNHARFDVRRMKGADAVVCVTCLDGQVQVVKGAEQVALNRGYQVRYDAAGLSEAVAIDTDIVSAWQRGIVVFRAAPLTEVVDEINRYRSGKIILVNRDLAHKQVSGRFRINQMDEIVARLQQAFGAKIRTLPGGIVLLS